jgi:hypothetical protein
MSDFVHPDLVDTSSTHAIGSRPKHSRHRGHHPVAACGNAVRRCHRDSRLFVPVRPVLDAYGVPGCLDANQALRGLCVVQPKTRELGKKTWALLAVLKIVGPGLLGVGT